MATVLENGSQRLYSISNPIKLHRMKGEMTNRKSFRSGACEKPHCFSNLSSSESTGLAFKQQEVELVVQQNAVWRKRKKQGKRKGRGRKKGKRTGMIFSS